MLPTVTLLTAPMVNWPVLIEDVPEAIGRSPYKVVTGHKGRLSYYAKFLATVGSMMDPTVSSATTILRESAGSLSLLSYTFYVEAEPQVFVDLLYQTRLPAVLGEGRASGVLGGTLDEWRSATVAGCRKSVSIELRSLFNQVIIIFDKLGLSDIWSDHKKRLLPDTTFYLEDLR